MGQLPFGTTTGPLGAELHEDGRRRLIPLAQPVPEACPQPEIAARSAGIGAAHPCKGALPAFCRRGPLVSLTRDRHCADPALHPSPCEELFESKHGLRKQANRHPLAISSVI